MVHFLCHPVQTHHCRPNCPCHRFQLYKHITILQLIIFVIIYIYLYIIVPKARDLHTNKVIVMHPTSGISRPGGVDRGPLDLKTGAGNNGYSNGN